MPPAVHQLIPSFTPRSAVGNHTLQVRALLHELGVRSEVYVGEASREVVGISRPFREYEGAPGDVLLYQASTGSALADFVRTRDERLVVNYHNITPSAMFAPWEPHVAAELVAGRRQVADLAARTTIAIADSSYNAGELDAFGYRNTTVVPILLDTATFERAVDTAALDRLRSAGARGATWLFVGRVAPNKAQHDLMKALAVYRRTYDPHARLVLVGGSSSHAYWTALESYRAALQLDDAVTFAGDVTDGELAAHYRAADVFVCASEHEGFCVPLLEAMHHELPIVAYASTAVPETLGDGGICIPSKAPTTFAAAVHRVLSDRALVDALAAAGRARLADFALDRTRAAFAVALAPVLDGQG
ncbi:MAG TPA: glycosyltransferase [Acidimicrobiales bacterium]|nr:glycosyltransferase [Acidimicrobiales bacterium]